MMQKCPTCLQEAFETPVFKKYGFLFDGRLIVRGDVKACLSRSQGLIFGVLARRYPAPCDLRMFAEAVYEGRDGPECENGTLRSIICQMRPRLKPAGLFVTCEHSDGYRLEVAEIAAPKEVAA